MKKIVALLIVGVLAWEGYGKFQQSPMPSLATPIDQAPVTNASFRCDGRTYCSQMTSCEEATWFLRNCPDTKMDGNNDGIPCEKQWCK